MTKTPAPVPHDAEEALLAFGLVPRRIATHFGNTTNVWRVDTDDGPFVLRRRARQDAAQLQTTHRLLRYLSPLRIAPEVRNAPNGEDFVATKEALWEVLTFLPGEVSTTGWDFDWDDDELLASSADLLGRLNQAFRDYQDAPTSTWYVRTPMPPRATLETYLRSHDTQETKQILELLPLIEAHLTASPPDETRHHVVHNDFAWYNVVRTGHAATGVIDFDSAQPNTELHEIAYATYAFAPINESIAGQPRSLARTAERVAIFVRVYEGRAGRLPVTADRLLSMAAQRVALSAADLLGGLLRGEERAQRLLPHLVGYMTWLGWYQRERRVLLEAIAEALSGWARDS
ncbi:MAG: aminoglycoside phosphotransferase family protein [Chloroflexi bacterium]|nr:MAG: aminoglycoside phosphotransferase family protein [Chloroflexota bacterium]